MAADVGKWECVTDEGFVSVSFEGLFECISWALSDHLNDHLLAQHSECGHAARRKCQSPPIAQSECAGVLESERACEMTAISFSVVDQKGTF